MTCRCTCNSPPRPCRLAVFIEEHVKDKNLARAVRRVVSTGVAPATLETASLIADKCPQEGECDFSSESAFLRNVDLGKAKPSDAKEARRIQRKWSTVISSAARRSAPGGTGWRYEHFGVWNEQTDASIPWILEAGAEGVEAWRREGRVGGGVLPREARQPGVHRKSGHAESTGRHFLMPKGLGPTRRKFVSWTPK